MNNEIKNLLLTTLFGFVICVILGLLFYGINYQTRISLINTGKKINLIREISITKEKLNNFDY